MSFNLDSLFVEWRSKVPTGVPNPKNAYHLVLLKEICLNKGIDIKIVDNVILALEQDDKKVDPETIVKFKNDDGENKTSFNSILKFYVVDGKIVWVNQFNQSVINE